MIVNNVRKLVLTAMFAAIIVAMTVIPYTGYISYGGVLEITTLHVIVILGATLLGWKSGLVIGGVWGITNLLRALTNPLWLPFVNPLVSVVPRILVALVAAVVYDALTKKFLKYRGSRTAILTDLSALIVAAVAATLTNTVLVLTAYYIFGGMIESYRAVFDLMSGILGTIIGLNGVVEMVLAIIVVPTLHTVLSKALSKQNP